MNGQSCAIHALSVVSVVSAYGFSFTQPPATCACAPKHFLTSPVLHDLGLASKFVYRDCVCVRLCPRQIGNCKGNRKEEQCTGSNCAQPPAATVRGLRKQIAK